MKRIWVLLILIALPIMLMACAVQQAATPAPGESTDSPTPLPEVDASPMPTQLPDASDQFPEAAYIAQSDLAKILNVPVDSIEIVQVDAVEWPDGCLGLGKPDEMCLQVITPGYLVKLQVDLEEYYYHTDETGNSLRMAKGPGLPSEGGSPESVFTWEGQNCEMLQVSASSLSFGRCGAELVLADQPELDWENHLNRWLAEYQPFQSETASGKLLLQGNGKLIASMAEQRAMGERAKLTFEILESGRAGAAWGIALTYSEEGGIAGVCDSVSIHLDGRVEVFDCKGFETRYELTAGQLEELYSWIERFQPTEFTVQDLASADGLTSQTLFSGSGKEALDEIEKGKIIEWIRVLISQARFTSEADPVELADAQATLLLYLNALASQDYTRAAEFYAGSTELLEEMNPEAEETLANLLGLGCKFNGFQCLPVRSISPAKPDDRGGFQFWVEFSNPDGTLFQRGPCCGEEPGPLQSRFLMSVIKNGNEWKAVDLPPYVP